MNMQGQSDIAEFEKFEKYNEPTTTIKGINYRNYEKGDDEGLAEVFNYAFQTNLGGVLRTPKNFHWRYVDYPDYDPRQINVAVEQKTGKIVGSIMGNIEEYYINGKKYSMGVINDVATMPGFGGRGIARNMMNKALNYFYDKKADFSILSADPAGFPREKIYLRYGYWDELMLSSLIHITNYRMAIKQLPLIAPFLPALSLTKIPKIATSMKTRFLSSYENDYAIEILHYKSTDEFRKRFNEIGMNQYDGFHLYTKEEWDWARNQCPIKMISPSQIVIRDKITDTIIAGSIVGSFNMYAVMFGIKARIGGIRNVFVDERYLTSKLKMKEPSISKENVARKIGEFYKILLSATIKASEERNNVVSMMMTGKDHRNLMWGAIHSGFFAGPGSIHMVKRLKPNLDYPKLKKPFYLDPGEDYGKW